MTAHALLHPPRLTALLRTATLERVVDWGLFLTLPVERVLSADVGGFTVRPIYLFMAVFIALHWREIAVGLHRFLPLVAILAAVVISLAGSHDLGQSLAYAVWAAVVVAFLATAASVLAADESRVREWARLYVLTAALWSALALAQWLGALVVGDLAYSWIGDTPRVQGPSYEPSVFSLYLVPALMLAIPHRAFLPGCLIAMGLVVSTGRTGLIGAAIGGGLLFVLLRRRALMRLALVALVAVATFGFAQAGPVVAHAVLPGVVKGAPADAANTAGSYGGFISDAANTEEATSVSPRLESWSQSWAVFEDDPLTGAGAGAFGEAVHALGRELDKPASKIKATNLWLEVPAELGLVGLIALVSWAAWPLPGLLGRPSNEPFVASVLAAFVASLVMLAFVQTWWVPSRWLPWLLAAGLAGALASARRAS